MVAADEGALRVGIIASEPSMFSAIKTIVELGSQITAQDTTMCDRAEDRLGSSLRR